MGEIHTPSGVSFASSVLIHIFCANNEQFHNWTWMKMAQVKVNAQTE